MFRKNTHSHQRINLFRTKDILVCCLTLGLWAIPFTNSAESQVTIETDSSSLIPGQTPPRRPMKEDGAQGAVQKEAEPDNEEFELDPFLLGVVQHRTLGLLEAEATPYYKVLEHARRVDYSRQVKTASENIARHEAAFRKQPENARIKFSLFADVFTHPEEYVGELLTMEGYVRKLLKHPLDPDDPAGVQTYEAWMYTPDSQHNPVVVVFSELPENMPLGGNLVEPIEVTGYFFKIYGYRAQDQIRAAPMLLAKTIKWKPNIPIDDSKDRIIYFSVTVGVVCLFILAFWWIGRRNRNRLQHVIQEPEGFDPSQLNDLAKHMPD